MIRRNKALGAPLWQRGEKQVVLERGVAQSQINRVLPVIKLSSSYLSTSLNNSVSIKMADFNAVAKQFTGKFQVPPYFLRASAGYIHIVEEIRDQKYN